ncbi:GAF domain-containing protein [Cochlodiniinecator piscidefendens]|uniref:GAF domain-containing protein n=1 Tax=Cochlodiniinecator piscidefendens TaxID=2715756 RepID=UPI00140A8B99|nr:GAF domain-containing protein [Cochlodiniinecator piscidefendens]
MGLINLLRPDAELRFGHRQFDVLAQSIVAKLGCKSALISISDGAMLTAVGHSTPPEGSRSLPAKDTVCQHTIQATQVLAIEDASREYWLKDTLTVKAFGIAGYLGVPLKIGSKVVGAACAITDTPRKWKECEVDFLSEIAQFASDKIELPLVKAEQIELAETLLQVDSVVSALSHIATETICIFSRGGRLLFSNANYDEKNGISLQAIDSVEKVELDGLLSQVFTAEHSNFQTDVLVKHQHLGNISASVSCEVVCNDLVLSRWQV